MKTYRYKFLREGLKSENGNTKWTLGEWKKFKGKLKMCKKGFHCSVEPSDAFNYIKGEYLALVEVKGNSIVAKDKEVWSEMRIVKKCRWTKEDNLRFAVYCAEQVLDIYEEKHPTDKRPRRAIQAAKRYLKSPTKKNADAAYAAYVRAIAAAQDADTAGYVAYTADYANYAVHASDYTAYAARASAYAAAQDADTAGYVAYVAAYVARAADVDYATRMAYATHTATRASYYATYTSNYAGMTKKIQTYFRKIAKEKLKLK